MAKDFNVIIFISENSDFCVFINGQNDRIDFSNWEHSDLYVYLPTSCKIRLNRKVGSYDNLKFNRQTFLN